MSEIKLKPCPFCGGKAALKGDFFSLVKCEECGAETRKIEISKNTALMKRQSKLGTGGLTMTPNEFVKLYMQNCQYRKELSLMAAAIAEENGLVVVFGASDDLCEIRGAEDDEIDCFDGGEATIAGAKVKINWCKDGYSWTYDTDVPHECFDVYDTDGEKYCRGIVFSISDMKAKTFMSDDEIIKIFKHCTSIDGCTGCPNSNKSVKQCIGEMSKNILDIINRQNSKIESLQERLDIADEETQLAHKANITYICECEQNRLKSLKKLGEDIKTVITAYLYDAVPFPSVITDKIDELVNKSVGRKENGSE